MSHHRYVIDVKEAEDTKYVTACYALAEKRHLWQVGFVLRACGPANVGALRRGL